MQKQAMPRTSKEWVDEMLRDHYRDARQAKEDGRLVCWSTSIAPQELLTTMDIVTMYPENHAAAIGARRDTEPFIAYTERKGYGPMPGSTWRMRSCSTVRRRICPCRISSCAPAISATR